MAEQLLKCPQCGAETFWIKDLVAGKIIFSISVDGSFLPKPPRDLNVAELDFSDIHCTNCPWHGKPSELKK